MYQYLQPLKALSSVSKISRAWPTTASLSDHSHNKRIGPVTIFTLAYDNFALINSPYTSLSVFFLAENGTINGFVANSQVSVCENEDMKISSICTHKNFLLYYISLLK